MGDVVHSMGGYVVVGSACLAAAAGQYLFEIFNQQEARRRLPPTLMLPLRISLLSLAVMCLHHG
jgi:hypothetical protein